MSEFATQQEAVEWADNVYVETAVTNPTVVVSIEKRNAHALLKNHPGKFAVVVSRKIKSCILTPKTSTVDIYQ